VPEKIALNIPILNETRQQIADRLEEIASRNSGAVSTPRACSRPGRDAGPLMMAPAAPKRERLRT
jgi:hypothetical protein